MRVRLSSIRPIHDILASNDARGMPRSLTSPGRHTYGISLTRHHGWNEVSEMLLQPLMIMILAESAESFHKSYVVLVHGMYGILSPEEKIHVHR